jgi:hypothetical protein
MDENKLWFVGLCLRSVTISALSIPTGDLDLSLGCMTPVWRYGRVAITVASHPGVPTNVVISPAIQLGQCLVVHVSIGPHGCGCLSPETSHIVLYLCGFLVPNRSFVPQTDLEIVSEVLEIVL